MPRSSRIKSAETRVNIVEAAFRLFVEQGYSATSMRDISRQAGVTVGGIYNHFQTKEEVWKEVILTKHPVHEILPYLLTAEGETTADVVHSAAQLMIRELSKRTDLFNLMFIEIVEFRAKHASDLFQVIKPRLVELQLMFHGKPGRTRSISEQVILRSFVGLFVSFYVTGIFLKNVNDLAFDQTILDQFVDLYLYGILDENDSADPEKA
jgi:AcrR family transcriptional regulator